MPGLQLRFTVEDVEPFEVWPGFRGRLSQIMLGLMAHDYLEREVFCCGPEPFMKSVREMLASLGYSSVLARGYAVIRREDRLVSRREGLEAGQAVTIEFADGRIDAVTGSSATTPPCRPVNALIAAVEFM